VRCVISEQERQARELYKRLLERFENSSSTTNISINEPGLHWNCSLNCDDRQCVIYCFGEKGFAISFKINDVSKARGRTRLENELISSVIRWLQGNNLNELHDDFEFIDPGKRALEKFWDQAIEVYPELEQCVNITLEPKSSESFCLWFYTSQRYCQIYFRSQRQFPTCEFYWEDFHIFEFSLEDDLEAALILKRWFCDNVMPSVLAQEFSRLDTGKLSQYYDFGKIIEEQYIKSWDEIEQFYIDCSKYWQDLDTFNILKFISQMRQKGFDRTLRAGHSFSALMLSRSLHWGLRVGQSSLVFEFHTGNLEIFTSQNARFSGKKKLCSPKIEYTPQVERLLKKLEAQAID